MLAGSLLHKSETGHFILDVTCLNSGAGSVLNMHDDLVGLRCMLSYVYYIYIYISNLFLSNVYTLNILLATAIK